MTVMNKIESVNNQNRLSAHIDSGWFNATVIGLIILNAILLGVETSAAIMAKYGNLLSTLNLLIQLLFVSEIALRLAARWPRPLSFFRDAWNIFDFLIVFCSLLPASGAFAGVARLARMLRVVRIVSVSHNLRLIIETMLLSIPSLGHVLLLLSLLLYVYGIIGFYLFSSVDPLHWGSLGRCLLSLFQIITLEGWVELQNSLLPTYPIAWIYFASFISIAVFVVINLFIAVVTNNLQSVKADHLDANSLASDLEDLKQTISRIETKIEKYKRF